MTLNAAPKITVIIPTYCASEQIHDSIDSLKAQTFADFEVIIVEDCSPDEGATLRLAQDIAASDSRFRVVTTKVNSGPGPARNIGIELARGEYITFLDSDDTLAPEALDSLYKLAKKHDADQVCYLMEYHYPNGRIVNHTEGKQEEVFTDPNEIRQIALDTISTSLEADHKRYPGSTISRLCKRDVLQKNNICFPKQHHLLSEDFHFVYESMCCAKKFVLCFNTYYHYVQREASISRNVREDMIERAVASAAYLAEIIKSDPGAPYNGEHYAWGYVLDVVRGNTKSIFMSDKSLSYKRKWMRKQADLPLFKKIYEEYPWRRLPVKHRLGFINFYKKRFSILYTLVVGQEKVRKLLGKI